MTLSHTVYHHSPVQVFKPDWGIRQREQRHMSNPEQLPLAMPPTLTFIQVFLLGKVSEQCMAGGQPDLLTLFKSKQLTEVMQFNSYFLWFYWSELILGNFNILISCTWDYNDLREYWTRVSQIYYWPKVMFNWS